MLILGDDIIGIPANKACGLGCAPPNALAEVIEAVDYVTHRKCGEGSFREVEEIILKGRQKT